MRGPSPHELAVRTWKEEIERLRDECGQTATEERANEAMNEAEAISQRIAEIRATTLAGLIFKAKYALAHDSYEPHPEVVESILADLMAMSAKQEART
jgi:hypothetical protein